jgi:hypothetical protein
MTKRSGMVRGRRFVVCIFLITLLFASACGLSEAAIADSRSAQELVRSARRQAGIARIQSALDARGVGPIARIKVAEKLPGLDDDRLRLMASLADRVIAADAPGGDIAFLLLASLLVLS